MTAERQIVGLGGGGDTAEQTYRLHDYVLGLTGKDRPKVLFLPTALADGTYSPLGVINFYEHFRDLAETSHLFTFPWPPADARNLILAQDAICVSGGNTANMLAIWRVHRIDEYLREAWEQGILLFGASAGMICWFEAGVTDSFRPELDGLDCLGLLPGSACPHYDGEERRRPRYRELVDDGFSEGIAADDGVGLRYVGTELREVVTCRPGAAAYRVTRDGEERLAAKELT
ncbi:MAG TPA: Type 1 glutamine amidotransferase-like domain-containing protein [Gaiellaceae bacterium]|nr:Type 1 glutamine amidotransferase-like domain-containing protein [Gaiellaceae bacterium]